MSLTPHLDLMEKAILKSGPKIYPCKRRNGKNRRWDKCFTESGDMLIFWYNTPDRDTHIVREKVR